MDMVPQENRPDIAEQSVEFFDLVSSEKTTAKALAKEHGLSLKTVYNRINAGREAYEKELREVSNKFIADVWKKYEWIWEEAKRQWETVKDPIYLKEMRSVLEAQRKMLSLDNAAKAPVNQDGTDHNDTLVMVFDDSNYKKNEAEYEQKVIDGTYTIQPQLEGDSTKVPLTETEEVV